MKTNAIIEFINYYLEIYNSLYGIQKFIFVFFTICVILFIVFYLKAIFTELKKLMV